MPENVPRSVVQAFYEAYVSRDPERIGAAVADDVEWNVFGPIDLMQICGTWRGRAAVMDRFARIAPSHIEFCSLEPESLLIDADGSAMFGRITCRHVATKRIISHRVAHFVRYRGGKAVKVDILNDSLDAAEQFVGHSIRGTAGESLLEDGLVAI
jgi:ketosteroid isomerase-like protein